MSNSILQRALILRSLCFCMYTCCHKHILEPRILAAGLTLPGCLNPVFSAINVAQGLKHHFSSKVANPIEITKLFCKSFAGIPRNFYEKKTCLGFGVSRQFLQNSTSGPGFCYLDGGWKECLLDGTGFHLGNCFFAPLPSHCGQQQILTNEARGKESGRNNIRHPDNKIPDLKTQVLFFFRKSFAGIPREFCGRISLIWWDCQLFIWIVEII